MQYLLALDITLFHLVNRLELGPVGDVFFRVVTLMGDWPGSVMVALTFLGLWWKRGWRLAAAFALTIVVSAAVNQGIKHGFERERPLAAVADIDLDRDKELVVAPEWGVRAEVGAVRLGTEPLFARSFPSGHAQHAFTWLVFLALIWPRGAAILIPLAFAVAISRVYLGVHFPLDVWVGGLLGAGFGFVGHGLATLWERRSPPHTTDDDTSTDDTS